MDRETPRMVFLPGTVLPGSFLGFIYILENVSILLALKEGTTCEQSFFIMVNMYEVTADVAMEGRT